MKLEKELIIPEGTTKILKNTFTIEQLKSVESITFPKPDFKTECHSERSEESRKRYFAE